MSINLKNSKIVQKGVFSGIPRQVNGFQTIGKAQKSSTIQILDTNGLLPDIFNDCFEKVNHGKRTIGEMRLTRNFCRQNLKPLGKVFISNFM